MKRIWLLLPLVVLLAGCPKSVAVNPPTPPINADHSITLVFNQSFADNPPCSATVTTSCINGFQEGYVTGTTNTQLHTDTQAICGPSVAPPATNCSTTFNGVVPLGSVTFYVTTTGVDQNGAAISSKTSGLASPVAVGLDAATNVTPTINN
jgi:hypothetical protein